MSVPLHRLSYANQSSSARPSSWVPSIDSRKSNVHHLPSRWIAVSYHSHSYPDIIPFDAPIESIWVVKVNGNWHFLTSSSMAARRRLINNEMNSFILETRPSMTTGEVTSLVVLPHSDLHTAMVPPKNIGCISTLC